MSTSICNSSKREPGMQVNTCIPGFFFASLCFSDFSGIHLRPRWGRSAGPPFSAMRKRGKNRQRRGLPPPCGIHPAVRGCPCTFFFPALGQVRSHRWHGNSIDCSYFSAKLYFECQGLTLVSRCSQLTNIWLPAAGTPLGQGRPGCGNHLAIGPAAQGVLVWWQN